MRFRRGGSEEPPVDLGARAEHLLAAGRRDAPPGNGGQRQTLVALGLLVPPMTTAAPLVTRWDLAPIGKTGWMRAGSWRVPQRLWRALPEVSRWMALGACVTMLRSDPPDGLFTAAAALPSVAQVQSAVAVSHPELTEAGSPEPPPTPRPVAQLRAKRPSWEANDRLAEDLAALEAARLALRMGDASKALRECQSYSDVFPRGQFAVEIAVVRIQSLLTLGRVQAAGAAGHEFLRQHARSPYAARVRSLIDSSEQRSAPRP